jgi:hypothetical protein
LLAEFLDVPVAKTEPFAHSLQPEPWLFHDMIRVRPPVSATAAVFHGGTAKGLPSGRLGRSTGPWT